MLIMDLLHTDNNDIVRASISQKSTERNQLCFRIPYLKVNEKQRYLGICTPLLWQNMAYLWFGTHSYRSRYYAVLHWGGH